MKLKNYGFIVLAPGFNPLKNKMCMASNQFKMTAVGVSSAQEAFNVAQEMVADGVEVIELCGGFGEELTQQVIAAIDGVIPIGHVIFQPEEMEKLRHFEETE